MKLCKYCNTEKDESEFKPSKKFKDGLMQVCASCEIQRKKDLNKAYRAQHRDALIEHSRAWRAAGNKPKRSEEARQRANERQKQRWKEDEQYRLRQAELKRIHRETNPEKYRQKSKDWQEDKPENSNKKTCKYCKTEKDKTEFNPSKKFKDVLMQICAACEIQRKKDLGKAYRAQHREALIEYARAWRAAGNKPKRSEETRRRANERQKQRWREDEQYRLRKKERDAIDRENNPEKYRRWNKEWREANLEKAREYAREYAKDKRRNDPEWQKQSLERRAVWRHRKWGEDKSGGPGWVKKVEDREISQETIKRLHAWQKDHCYFCNKFMEKVTIEHILPRSHGGPSVEQNLALTCESCNYSRQNKIFHIEWLPDEFFPSSDNFYLSQKTVGEVLRSAGFENVHLENGAWVVQVGDIIKKIFIISTFFGSSRNTASFAGKVAAATQEDNENAIILFDNEWFYRRESCLNMLRSKFNISLRSPGARTLEIVEVPQSESHSFLDSHHVMGKKISTTLRLGLSDGNALFGIGLFSDKGETWECDRLAFHGHVPGGMSKIMSHVWKKYGYKPIRSFVDSRYANGAGHETIGFSQVGMSPPSFQWVFPNRIQHQRYLSNENKQSQNLLYFNPDISPEDNIISNGVFKIWTPKRHIIVYEK